MHDTSVSPATLYRAFAYEHATIPALAKRFHLCEKTIRTRLDEHELPEYAPVPRTMVAVIDATKIGLMWFLVVRDPNEKENVYAKEISSETTFSYQMAHEDLKEKGFTFSAIVSDGRFVAAEWLFPGIPVQMCHYHQIQIIIRYLTLNPKIPAGIELLELVRTLPTTDEASFTDAFNVWCRTWSDFLKEKTVDEKTGKWSWTHKRLRQAQSSVRMHLLFLFTFERYPHLNIPNTTNSLDGSFKKVKLALAVHAGLSQERKLKLVRALTFPI